VPKTKGINPLRNAQGETGIAQKEIPANREKREKERKERKEKEGEKERE
jgi:hypothetical protein